MPRRTLEHWARRYLASRGTPPMVADPVGVALPRLAREASRVRWTARRDLGLAFGLTIAGIASGASILVMPLGNDLLIALLRLHLVPLLGLGGALWGAILFERTGPILTAARAVIQYLATGALVEAFQTALSGLPAPLR